MENRLAFAIWKSQQDGRRIALMLIAAVATPFLLAILVTALRPTRGPTAAELSGQHSGTPSRSLSREQEGGGILARLENYARSIKAENPVSSPTSPSATRDLLPDVNTMIDRLTARLEKSPEDATGWRMLGWSNFHLERYEQAAVAYARAMELDPASDELKRSYEEAVAKTLRPLAP